MWRINVSRLYGYPSIEAAIERYCALRRKYSIKLRLLREEGLETSTHITGLRQEIITLGQRLSNNGVDLSHVYNSYINSIEGE